ncbi:MAG: response regulator transcription factor [Candidatus Geothermincolales bacterium]
MIRLVVVDDHPIARLGVQRMIEGAGDVVLVGEAESGSEALRMIRERKPHVALVDIKLPDMSGIDLVYTLKGDPDTAEVEAVMLTVIEDLDVAAEAIKAGAIGYLLKDCGREQLLHAVRSARMGIPVVSQPISQKLFELIRKGERKDGPALPEVLPFGLTERECEVLRLLAQGFGNKSIANQLSISVSTVKVHIRNLYRKLGVEDRAHAIIKAIKEGII